MLPALGQAVFIFAWARPSLRLKRLTAQRALQADQQASIENLVAKVELHLQKQSQRRSRLGGSGTGVYAARPLHGFGECLAKYAFCCLERAPIAKPISASPWWRRRMEIVTAEAKTAFVRAVTLDNTTVSARYYLGMAAEQDGKREEAAKIWRELIAEAPSGAHWLNDVRDGACPRRRPALPHHHLPHTGR